MHLSLNICKGALALLLSYIWRGKRPQTGPYMILRASINSNLHMFLERSIEPLENWRSIQQKVSYLKSWGRLWAWTWTNVFLGRLILQGLCMRRQTESALPVQSIQPGSTGLKRNMRACWYSSWGQSPASIRERIFEGSENRGYPCLPSQRWC